MPDREKSSRLSKKKWRGKRVSNKGLPTEGVLWNK